MSKLAQKLLLICAASFLQTACTTYSRSECEAFDWKQRGYSSALKGQATHEGLAHYNKECAEIHDVLPVVGEFKQGYLAGNKVFCTANYGSTFGLKGGEYRSGLCSEEDEPKFLKPYVKGINIFYKNQVSRLEAEVSNLRSEVNSLESEVSSLESEVSSAQSKTCD